MFSIYSGINILPPTLALTYLLDHYLNKLECTLIEDAFKRLTTFPARRFLRRLLKIFNIYSYVRIRPPPHIKIVTSPYPRAKDEFLPLSQMKWDGKVTEWIFVLFSHISRPFSYHSVELYPVGIMILRNLNLPYPRFVYIP